MKRMYLIVLIALFGLSTQTQAQSLKEKLAQAGCDCISKKDTDKMTQEQLQMELGACLMISMGDFQAEFATEYKDLDMTNQAAMTKFGEEIGMIMATKCPTVFMRMSAQANAASADEPKGGTMSGTIKEITGDDVATIVITDSNGRSHKLLWLGFFKGSDQLQDASKAAGKKVKVMYEEMEVYSPKAKEYYPRKKVTGIEFQ